MPEYPNAIFVPRTIENRPGVVYDETKSKVAYAEDQNLPNDEIVAIETELGLNPRGAYESVAERLDSIGLASYSIFEVIDSEYAVEETSGEVILLANPDASGGGYPAGFPALPEGTENYVVIRQIDDSFVYFKDFTGIYDYSGQYLQPYGTSVKRYVWNGSAWGSDTGWTTSLIKTGSFYDNCYSDVLDLTFHNTYGQGAYLTNYPDLLVNPTDGTVFSFTGSSTLALTLPTAVDNTLKLTVKLKKLCTVTLTPDGSETIDGEADFILAGIYDYLTIVSDGSDWYIISFKST